jgi:hypothetical protein
LKVIAMRGAATALALALLCVGATRRTEAEGHESYERVYLHVVGMT